MAEYTTRDALMQIKALIEAAIVAPQIETAILTEVTRIAQHAMSHAKVRS